MLPNKEFYSARELAEILGVSVTTLYRMVRAGTLPCYAVGRSRRFHRDEIATWLQQNRVERTDIISDNGN